MPFMYLLDEVPKRLRKKFLIPSDVKFLKT